MSLHSSLPRVLILAGREPIVPGATLPGKTSRLIDHARRVVQRSGAVADVLDLGWLDHAADEASAWTKSVRERWNAAHGVMVLVPERWNTADSSLRSLVEELARDPTRVRETAYGVILQGEDPAAPFGDEKLAAHLEEMGLVPALDAADPLRSAESYPGYYEPGDGAGMAERTLHERVRNVARAVVNAARKLRRLARDQRDAAGFDSAPHIFECGLPLR